MIRKSVLLVGLLLIIESNVQKQCPSGQFERNGNCHKCGPCYDMWKDKIIPDENNLLDFVSLEKDIQRIEDRLRNNSEKLALLRKSKTELLSRLKHAQSTQNSFNKDIYTMAAANDEWTKMVNIDKEKLRHLEDDILKLRKESESKPADDNSGYFHQMDKAKTEAKHAAEKQETAVNKIKDMENACKVLNEKDLNITLGGRIKDEQDNIEQFRIQYQDTFLTKNPCEDKLCVFNTKCRVCKDFEKCFDKDMLKAAADILKSKFENLEKQADETLTSIPSLHNELDLIKKEKKLVEDVLNTTNSSEININKRIKAFLDNFSFDYVDIYNSILKLQPNKDESYIKKLVTKINAMIKDWQRIHSNDMNDLLNKSEELLYRSEIMKDNAEFLSETIRAVKDILRSENVTNTEEVPLKSFLLELSEILDEIDRRYTKVLHKKSIVEEKMIKLEQLGMATDNKLKKILTASDKTKQESIEINANVNNELEELIKKLGILQEMEKRKIAINKFWDRITELRTRSENLVDEINNNVPDYSAVNMYADYLETSIEISLKEMDDILEIVTNKSRVYEKCS